MNYTYEEYLDKKKENSNLFKAIKLGIEGTADIPFLGNSIKAGATVVSQSIENKSHLSKSIKQQQQVNYFILQADDYYDDLARKIFDILEMKKIQQKYKFKITDIQVEIHENVDADCKLIDNFVEITFFDNEYYNEKLKENQWGSVYISFQEILKQINFLDNKVYIAFNINSVGGNNIYNDFERDYIEFANLICYLLSNDRLI